MSVTINAHQLKLLIDKTADHMGHEGQEQLYGIRFDADSQYLYAVASDRYTVAVARYRLNHGDQNQEPWTATLPGEHLPMLREWTDAMKGSENVTISVAKNRLVFEGETADINLGINPAAAFPDWRGLLRGIAAQTVEGEPFPALNPDLLKRWSATGQSLRVRITADKKAVLLFGEDFIGAQMPSHEGPIGPVKETTIQAAHDLWLWTLAAGATDVDMASLPQPEPSCVDALRDIRETTGTLLRGVLDSTSNVYRSNFDDDQDAWYAHIRSGVSDWMAYRFLDALHQVDPRAAQKVVDETAEQLDDGELGEWAWDMAERSGHNPQAWEDDHKARVAKQTAEEPAKWARRLARGLNDARDAGIEFRVDDNPHVVFDAEAGEWKATHPQAADTPA